jgi:hypothetical protein
VSFNSGARKGHTSKTVSVESNDPVKPKTTLKISAFVEVEFGFETNTLNMGRIPKGESDTRNAVLLLKDASKTDLVEVSTNSPDINARIINSDSGEEGRIEVEVTVNANMPPGRLNDMITATLTDESQPAATLRVVGDIIGNVELKPEAIHFTIDTSQATATEPFQEVRVVTTRDAASFNLLGVHDSRNLLTFEVDTLVAGKQYLLKAKPNENAMQLKRVTSGLVKVEIDDAEQPELNLSYRIILRRQ